MLVSLYLFPQKSKYPFSQHLLPLHNQFTNFIPQNTVTNHWRTSLSFVRTLNKRQPPLPTTTTTTMTTTVKSTFLSPHHQFLSNFHEHYRPIFVYFILSFSLLVVQHIPPSSQYETELESFVQCFPLVQLWESCVSVSYFLFVWLTIRTSTQGWNHVFFWVIACLLNYCIIHQRRWTKVNSYKTFTLGAKNY